VEYSGGHRGGFYRVRGGRWRGGRSNGGNECPLRPFRPGLKGIKGGNDEGAVKARRHPRHGAGDAGSGGAEESQPGTAGTVEKMKLTSGPPVSAVDREKAPRTEGVNQRRKRTSENTPTTSVGRVAWASQLALACERREASGVGWAKGRVGF
jgi:hypothetical protein